MSISKGFKNQQKNRVRDYTFNGVKYTLFYEASSGKTELLRQDWVGIFPTGTTLVFNDGNFTENGKSDSTLNGEGLDNIQNLLKNAVINAHQKSGGNAKNNILPSWASGQGVVENNDIEVGEISSGMKKTENGWEFVGSDLTKWTISKLMEHGPLHYPIDAMYSTSPKSTVNQDHIRILQYTYRAPSSFILGQQSTSNASTVLSSGLPRVSPLKEYLGLVKLPMPTNISDSNNVNWGEDKMGQLSAAMTSAVMGNKLAAGAGVAGGGMLAGGPGAFIGLLAALGLTDKNAMDSLENGGGLNALGNTVKETFNGSSPQGMILGTALSSRILAAGGFNVDANAILSRGAGVAPQSNLELLFQSPALRTFDFAWKMTPRSEREARITKNIVRFFKQGMAARKQEGLAGGASLFLGAPNIFQVQYKTNNNQDIEGVNRIKTCACTGCSVNYTPDGVWSAYEKGQPVSTVMSLRFAELEPIYDTDYQEAIENGREWEEPGWASREGTGDLYPIGIDEVGY